MRSAYPTTAIPAALAPALAVLASALLAACSGGSRGAPGRPSSGSSGVTPAADERDRTATPTASGPRRRVRTAEVDPDSLPRWNAATSGPGGDPLSLLAVDADLTALAIELGSPGTMMVAVHRARPRVTGRMGTTDGGEALAALARTFPAAGLTPDHVADERSPARVRHRGKKLDLAQAAVAPADVVRILGEAAGLDVALPPQSSTLDVVLSDIPWDAALERLARELGLALQRQGRLVLLVPRARAGRMARPRGPRATLDVRGVSPGAALDLLRAVAPVSGAVPCEGGDAMSARLVAGHPTGSLAQAIALLGDVALAPRGAGCGTSELDPSSLDPEADRVVGVASRGKRSAALVRHQNRTYLLRPGKDTAGRTIALLGNRIDIDPSPDPTRPNDNLALDSPRVYDLSGSAAPDYVEHPERWRVTATILHRDRATALLESDTGETARFAHARGEPEPADDDPLSRDIPRILAIEATFVLLRAPGRDEDIRLSLRRRPPR